MGKFPKETFLVDSRHSSDQSELFIYVNKSPLYLCLTCLFLSNTSLLKSTRLIPIGYGPTLLTKLEEGTVFNYVEIYAWATVKGQLWLLLWIWPERGSITFSQTTVLNTWPRILKTSWTSTESDDDWPFRTLPNKMGLQKEKSNFSWDSEMSPITLESAAAFLGWGCSYS